MIELRSLAHFVAACQRTSLGRAAEGMGVALSTLSATLKALEDEIGLKLFYRGQDGLVPTPAGLWLYRTAIPLLHAENFARAFAMAGHETAQPSYMLIDVRLRFTLGRLSKALERAIGGLQSEFPTTFFEPVWTAYNDPPAPQAFWGDVGHIIIDYSPGGEIIAPDPWVLVHAFAATIGKDSEPNNFPDRAIVVPALPEQLLAELGRHLELHGMNNVRFSQDDAAELAPRTRSRPEQVLLLPQSMVAARLGHLHLQIEPFTPSLVSHITATAMARDDRAKAIIAQLKRALASPEANSALDPQITMRQFDYLRLLHSHRSVTAAARIAQVAQPAVSGQLRKLEAAVGCRLFERNRDGILPTKAGLRLSLAGEIVKARAHDLYLNRVSAAGVASEYLHIGVLPAIGDDGVLLTRIADALVRWRKDHPKIAVKILEAPSALLQAWVQAGTIGLAVVETEIPHMARFSMRMAEALAVVANPAHGLLPDKPVDIHRLQQLPLALPTASFGIRRLIDTAASVAGIALRPAMEVNSLPMLISLVGRDQLCTVLPLSAIPRHLAGGELESRPLIPAIERSLHIIYSSARRLTPAERALIARLRDHVTEFQANPSPGAG